MHIVMIFVLQIVGVNELMDLHIIMRNSLGFEYIYSKNFQFVDYLKSILCSCW